MTETDNQNQDDTLALTPKTARFNPKKRAFLAAYLASGGNVTRASNAAQVDRTAHYRWLTEDAAYLEAFTNAREMAADTLEDEATRRAFEGTEKPIYQGGVKVGTVTEYSDTLMMFLLKAQRPRKYRERASVEMSSDLDAEIHRLLLQLLTDEELLAVRDGKRDVREFLPRYYQHYPSPGIPTVNALTQLTQS